MRRINIIPDKITHLLVFAMLVMLLFSSCEKVIDIKLNNTDKKYVIEGNVTNVANSCFVKISQTVNFSDPNVFPSVDNAIVTIQDGTNPPVALSYFGYGQYYHPNIIGVSGHTYTLKVMIDDKVFTASATIPKQVPLDSVFIKPETLLGVTNLYAHVAYHDPIGKGNSYRFVKTVNNMMDVSVYVSNDEYTDGNEIQDFLQSRRDNANNKKEVFLQKGDVVKMEMQCIDPNVYTYWSTLQNNQNSIPSNPITNITGGALGYFSAHTSEIKTVTVK